MMFLLVALSMMALGEAQAEQRKPQKGNAPVKVKVDIDVKKDGCYPSMHGKPYGSVCNKHSKPSKRGCNKECYVGHGKPHGRPMRGCPVCAERFGHKGHPHHHPGHPGHHPEFRPDGRPNGRPDGNHDGRPDGNHGGRPGSRR